MRTELRTVALALAVCLAPACVVWDSRVQSGPPGRPLPPPREPPGAVSTPAAPRAAEAPPALPDPAEAAAPSAELAREEPAAAPAVSEESVAAAEPAPAEAPPEAPAGPEPPSAPVAASAPRVPAPLTRERALDVALVGADGSPLGRLDDLWADPRTGALEALVVATDDPEQRLVLAPSCVEWDAGDEPLEPVLLGASAAEVLQGLAGRATLYAARKAEAISGEITDVDEDPTCPLLVRVVQLRDEANLLHRVLVEPRLVVDRLAPELVVGRRARFLGVPTRDDAGKLWIAGAVEVGGRELALRDQAGRVAWRTLGAELVSARALSGSAARTSDGIELAVAGWTLDPAGERVAEIVVRGGALERRVPWSALRRGANGAWSLALSEPELAALPAPRSGTPAADDPDQ